MDLELIKQIVNSGLPDESKEYKIIQVLADDEKAIPEIMKILESERSMQRRLIMDMNAELSRSHIFIELEVPDKPSKNKKNPNEGFSKGFVVGEIEKFYVKYKSVVTHCFNRFND